MIGEALLHARANAEAEQLQKHGPNPHLASIPTDEYNRYLLGKDAATTEDLPLGAFEPVGSRLKLSIYDDLVLGRYFDPLKDPSEFVERLIQADLPSYRPRCYETEQPQPEIKDTPTRKLTIVRSLGETGVSLAEQAIAADPVTEDELTVAADQSATPESVVHHPVTLAKFADGLKNTPLPDTIIASPVDWFGTGQ